MERKPRAMDQDRPRPPSQGEGKDLTKDLTNESESEGETRAHRRELAGLPLDALRRVCVQELGLERYRAEQLFSWIHGRGVTQFAEMTNLSKKLRERLAAQAHVETLRETDLSTTADGVTKLALQTHDGHLIETVLIPEGNKLTQCVSTQVGCRMGCRFCATAQMGFTRHLSAAEIVSQVALGRRQAEASGRRLSNLVYMGMGEPLDNYEAVCDSLRILLEPLGHNFSTRKITVSTVGHAQGLRRLATEEFQVNLAVSINATTQRQRVQLMPAAKRWPLDELMKALHDFPLEKRRRVTVEYVLLAGVNDSLEDARRLAKLFRRLPSKINLIRINPFHGCPYTPPTMAHTERFQAILRDAHYTVFLRKSRGAEIQAGCGQLAAGGGEGKTDQFASDP